MCEAFNFDTLFYHCSIMEDCSRRMMEAERGWAGGEVNRKVVYYGGCNLRRHEAAKMEAGQLGEPYLSAYTHTLKEAN